MKVLVSVKRVIDYQVQVQIKKDGSGIDAQNIKMSMNPFDEIALEEAIRLKEQGIASEVLAVSLGSNESQETLRHALAMGADRALLIETVNELEPIQVAQSLQALVAKETPDLILMGKQAIDDDCNQTGQMLAGLLHWSQATFASKINIKENEAEVIREVDGGLETIRVQLPAVITSDLRLNEPRYISLPNIMRAKQKQIDIIPIEALKINLKPHVNTIEITAPPQRSSGIKVSNIEELMDKLKNKEKLL